MAAAAYASLVSLLNTMDQIQIHPLLSTSLKKYTSESLRAKIHFFLDFIEKYSDAESKEAEDLMKRIAVAAHEAEDVIEVQAAHRIRSGSPRRSRKMPRGEMKKILEEMESIKGEIVSINQQTSSSPPLETENDSEAEDSVMKIAALALESDEIIQFQSPTTKMVGFEGYLEQLLDRLTAPPSSLQILPIVGMGGICKTTLARNVYENLLIIEYFYVRAWANVSQDFNVGEILLQTLHCLGKPYSKTDSSVGELGVELYKILYGR